eukprot:716545_1
MDINHYIKHSFKTDAFTAKVINIAKDINKTMRKPMSIQNLRELLQKEQMNESLLRNITQDTMEQKAIKYGIKPHHAMKILHKLRADILNRTENESKASEQERRSGRTSFLTHDFKALKEVKQWNTVSARLNAVFDPSIAATLKTHAAEEEYDIKGILEDIEPYPVDPNDSSIIQYMQVTFGWDNKECDSFYRTIKRILTEPQDWRNELDIGSKCKIYSKMRRTWTEGQVTDASEEKDDDHLTVQWTVNGITKSKSVRRDGNCIRPPGTGDPTPPELREPRSMQLHRFNPQDICDHIENWVINDMNHKTYLARTKDVFANRKLS